MKPLILPHRLALAVTTLALASSSYGAITLTTGNNAVSANATGALTSDSGLAFLSTSWSNQDSNTDLVNNGQSTLGGVTPAGIGNNSLGGSFNINNINNSNGTNATADGSAGLFIAKTTQYSTSVGFTGTGSTATIIFDLNTSTNTYGYDITSIKSFMGLATTSVSDAQANQTYTVEYSAVGSATYAFLTTVNYTPFKNNTTSANHLSYVKIDENNGAGILASRVDSIRFTFTSPTTATSNAAEGTVINELDVNGIASIPEPSAALLGGLGMLALLRRRRA